MPDPTFPPEIEYIIFTTALELNNGGSSARNLILVAKRVHEWLIPKIMRTLAMQAVSPPQRYPFRWDINTLQQYGRHTRNLFIWTPIGHNEDAHQYLCLCSNVKNLLLWSQDGLNHPQLEALSRLSLTHLSTDLTHISEPSPDLVHLFSKITHLDSLSAIHLEPSIKVETFTSLTHLAIPYLDGNASTPLFEKVPTLQVLLLLEHGAVMGLIEGFDPKVDDPRIVRVTYRFNYEVGDWLLDVEEGRGMWGLADQAVRERKKLKET
ncbi:hypothetical protein BDN72DRAFT_845157 [Pluteus cervinus]|uniref:Uncharacterized protein n=1 Tax=Pluteus cervinus TaxID=181527 RepID=A0ACD3AJ31_9AGAR|nr:hypothetical protein BDN72DRAFT_845157 [Pluteus cervinus]